MIGWGMMEFETRQIVIAHEVMWEVISEWAGKRGLRLVQIPGSGYAEDDLPAYIFSPIDPTKLR